MIDVLNLWVFPGFPRPSPPSLPTGARVAAERGHKKHEGLLSDMVLAQTERFGFEDIVGLPWTETDAVADVGKAPALLPELAA